MHTRPWSSTGPVKGPIPGAGGAAVGGRSAGGRRGTTLGKRRLIVGVIAALAVVWVVTGASSSTDYGSESDGRAPLVGQGRPRSSGGRRRAPLSDGEDEAVPVSDELSIEERFRKWSGGRDLTRDAVPLPDTGRIPDRLFLNWKSKRLGARARRFLHNFRTHEPQLEVAVLTDDECSTLAAFYPDLGDRYEALPLAVMRADICRVLAVYYFGGMYKDLDIDWRMPLREWLDPTLPVAYGWEDREHLCQWFFAARPGNPCLRNILQQITNLIADPASYDFNTNVEAVIDITGPGVWTDAMQGCPTAASYNYTHMRTTYIHHDYAAAKWVGASTNQHDTNHTVDPSVNDDGYVSWLEERKKKAGWQSTWQKFDHQGFAMADSADHLSPVDTELPPLKVPLVEQSSVFLSACELFGPRHAVDGIMDTGAVTMEDDAADLQFTFAQPLTFGTLYGLPATPEERATHISAVRFFNRQREIATFSDWFSYGVQLFNESGHIVHELHKDGHPAPYYTFYLGGYPNKFNRIRLVRRDGGAIGVNEVQFYMEPTMKVARRLELGEFRTACLPPEAESPLYKLVTNITFHGCGSTRAFSADKSFQYVMCGRASEVLAPPIADARGPGARCRALIFSLQDMNHGTINSGFLRTLHDAGCDIETVGSVPLVPSSQAELDRAGVRFGHHHQTEWCQGKKKCDISDEIESALGGANAATVAYLDMSTLDWRLGPPISFPHAFRTFRADTLLMPLRMDARTMNKPAVIANVRALLETYELYSFHVNVGAGLFSSEYGIPVPTEVQLCFRRKKGL